MEQQLRPVFDNPTAKDYLEGAKCNGTMACIIDHKNSRRILLARTTNRMCKGKCYF